jgi:hypothetical protein
LKCPWGENGGLQDRPGGLIDDPQPGDFLAGSELLLLDRVHLPDRMGLAAAGRLPGARPARRGGRHAPPAEEPLDGARAGQRLTRQEPGQFDAYAPRPPAGALAAKGRGQLVPGQRPHQVLPAGVVIGTQGVVAALGEAP